MDGRLVASICANVGRVREKHFHYQVRFHSMVARFDRELAAVDFELNQLMVEFRDRFATATGAAERRTDVSDRDFQRWTRYVSSTIRQIRSSCFKTLTLHQPYASDFRRLIATENIARELEDLARATRSIAWHGSRWAHVAKGGLPDSIRLLMQDAELAVNLACAESLGATVRANRLSTIFSSESRYDDCEQDLAEFLRSTFDGQKFSDLILMYRDLVDAFRAAHRILRYQRFQFDGII